MSQRYDKEWDKTKSRKHLFDYLQAAPAVKKGVVFDIGTRAIRILCGPQQLPEHNWGKNLFFNDRILTHLGADITAQQIIPLSCRGLKKVVDFILFYKKLLAKHRIPLDHCMGFGTAVFRWAKNKHEVIAHLRQQTGMAIHLLSAHDEARYSMRGLQTTYTMRRESPNKIFGKEDVLLLLDQGGGSLEVSYAFVHDFEKNGFFSFNDLGTIALKHRFFAGNERQNPIVPGENPNLVSKQCQSTLAYVQERIANWQGYPQLRGKKIHGYAIGSAVKRLVDKSPYDMHNTPIDYHTFIERIEQHDWNQKQKMMPTSQLYQHPGSQQHEMVFLMRYGLLPYVELLKKFSLQKINVCGYGLRYGVFAGMYQWNDAPKCQLQSQSHTKGK